MGYRWPISLEEEGSAAWVGEHRPDLVDLEGLFAGLVALDSEDSPAPEQWRAVLPAPAAFIRLLGPHTAHVHISGAVVSDLAVKLATPRVGPRWRRITDQVRHSRSHRRHLWAHRLRALGIDTPRPLGFIERAHHPALDKSFAVTEYVFAPNLAEVREHRLPAFDAGREAVLEKRNLIRGVAELTRELHARGLFPAELSGRRMLVTDESIMLTGVEAMRSALLPERASLQDLVKLHHESLQARRVTRTDRMRFIDTYLRYSPRRASERRSLFRRIGEDTAGLLDAPGPA